MLYPAVSRHITLALVTIFGVALVGATDYWSGHSLYFAGFYLVPVSIASWYGGRIQGYSAAILSTVAWLAVDIAAATVYSRFPIWNTLVRGGVFLVTAHLIAIIRWKLEHERLLATVDGLTGVANARGIRKAVEKEMARARRSGLALTAAYIDLDNFKVVNDTFGHETGDELLVRVANTLSHHVRATDVVGRLGGDEFFVLFPELDLEKASHLAEHLSERLLGEMAKKDWPVTFSTGVVVFENLPSTSAELIRLADEVMYRAKKSGKNRLKIEMFKKSA